VPDGAVKDGYSRSLADKSESHPPALMQVIARAVSAFQAGHEGSIPFARSNQKPQVRAQLCCRRDPEDPALTASHAVHVPLKPRDAAGRGCGKLYHES
jgi:hypothetical protein